LRIGAGDEAQIGATHLEWDIMIFAVSQALQKEPRSTQHRVVDLLEVSGDEHARGNLAAVSGRLRSTWYKRVNPIRLDHPLMDRCDLHDQVDESLFRPEVLRR
jgi:NAD+ synthase